ncbi:MAG: hypothetical protein KGJ15_03760 [Betaproteobacteria bacterium]|nr:hypothetical protein [Betaproteobacteria bacterium]MDE2131861.1 hypothetical protein [Betaproteobacteria bacterium]MDE2211668.1 hypothetical protein [Betaproteobacteria bacterium]
MRHLQMPARFMRFLIALCLLGGTLLLSSCGGGAAALLAGVGSGGTGLVEGVVVGFGSVFIDGKEYATTNATVEQDNDLGQPQVALLKLGQRVRASIDSTGAAVITATVIPSLSGPVTSAAVQDAATGDWWLQVLGQWVRVVSTATNTPLGLTTVLAGLGTTSPSASQLTVGSEVEVHGTWVSDATHNAYVLVASRVESLSSPSTYVLIGGVITQLPSTNQVMINASPGTILQGTVPAGTVVGETISAWVPRSTWSNWSGGTHPLMVASLGQANLAAQSGSSSQSAQLSGLVSSYNPATHVARVQGTLVQLPASYNVGDGDYIRVSGQVTATGMSTSTVDDLQVAGSVQAQAIQVMGTTNGINWSAGGTVTFILQGTTITAASGTYPSCVGLTAINTAVVSASGSVPAPGQPVVASSVTCTAVTTPPSGSVSDFKGSILSVSASGNTLVMQNEENQLTVIWTASTFIDPALGSVPSVGQAVEVYGTLNGSTLTAVAIRSRNSGTND